MSKKRLINYTFDASAKTIVEDEFSVCTLAGIILITNVTDNVIIYNFSDPTKGGTLSVDTLTLDYDTTSMSDTDDLMILVDDGLPTSVTVSGSPSVNIEGIDGTTPDTNAGAVSDGTLRVVHANDASIAVTQSGTWDEVGINDSGNSITVDYATTGSGTATGALRVELPTNGTGVIATVGAVTSLTNALPAGTNAIGKLAANSGVDIGDVDVTTIGGQTPTFGAGSVAAGTQRVTHASDDPVTTSVQLIDDAIFVDDTATHSTGSTKVMGIGAVATPTDTAVNANDIGMVGMTNNREQYISLRDNNGTATASGSGTAAAAIRVELPTNGTGVVGLNAGTNAIGKLAANSGVDIGDVDVTSISAGTNLIGDVGIQPRTTNGLDTFMASGSDGSTILVATAQAVKASAGKVYGYYIYNPESAVTFVHFYNTASGSVTVGTTNPLFTLAIPATSGANLQSEIGITFSTAITVSATTTAGGNTSPATGVSLVCWYK